MGNLKAYIKTKTTLENSLGTRSIVVGKLENQQSLFTFHTVTSPHGNCQTFSVVYMNQILDYCENPIDIIKETVKDIGKYHSKYSWKDLFDMIGIKDQKTLTEYLSKVK